MPAESKLQPELRLFLSVDVQDSTAFKQQADERDAAPWREYFAAYFRDFPKELQAQLPPTAPLPAIWKLLGDEIVFTHRISTLPEIAWLVVAFRTAVAEYRPKISKPRNLRLKASAWVASFPVGNAIVPLDNGQEDYIGPAMDTGFRLGHLATRRKFTLSVELVWLLLNAPVAERKALPLFYDGRCALKGIMERDGYPFIWTDLFLVRPPPLVRAEDALQKTLPVQTAALRRFCERYIRVHGEPRYVPFISGHFDRRTAEEKRRYQAELDDVEVSLRRLPGKRELAATVAALGPKRAAEADKITEFKRLLGGKG